LARRLPECRLRQSPLVYNVRVDPSLIGELSKPILSLADPVLARVGKWLGYQKPHLYVHFQLRQLVWCIATESQQNGPPKEYMQAVFWADLNHDSDEPLVIMSAFPDGTTPQLATATRLVIPPRQIVHSQILAIALPIRGKKGVDWRGRFVLLDQFRRKYKTQRATFRWVGPSEPPAE